MQNTIGITVGDQVHRAQDAMERLSNGERHRQLAEGEAVSGRLVGCFPMEICRSSSLEHILIGDYVLPCHAGLISALQSVPVGAFVTVTCLDRQTKPFAYSAVIG